MKLYRINCYGLNYGVGNREGEAIDFYLHRHPELEKVENIKFNLTGTVIFNSDRFAECFSQLYNHPNTDTTQLQNIIIGHLDDIDEQYSMDDIHDILEIYNLLVMGATIYGCLDNPLWFFDCDLSIDEFFEQQSLMRFSDSSLPTVKSLLESLGFNKVSETEYQLDNEYSGESFLANYETRSISLYRDTGFEAEWIKEMSIGQFIDDYIGIE